MKQKNYIFFFFLFFIIFNLRSQSVNLYNQFNGRFDFVYFGNTLNPNENSFMSSASVLTSSSASLNLNATDVIEKAYLYWAGSGTGDFSVKLNNIDILPDRTFALQRVIGNLTFDYFSAFKDVTTLIAATGNGNYTLSELDVTPFIDSHFTRRTNFAGWAIVVVYKNPNLPLNQLNIYDGLEAVPNVVDINLNSLNVIDNVDAKIGFLAWEGDVGIAVNESLRINGNVLSNPPLNPANNAFNGTNSSTGATNLYNMDLDVYSIQNNINVGDTSALIQLTSNQDFVMINNIVTKLNSQLPDATIAITQTIQNCNSNQYQFNYRVSNSNSTDFLPAGTFITFYINSIAISTIQTPENIPIGEFRDYSITVTINENSTFEIKAIVDDNNGIAAITETNENNNIDTENINIWTKPTFTVLNDITTCIESGTNYFFDFAEYAETVKTNLTDTVTFFETQNDAFTNINAITTIFNFEVALNQSPKTIYVKIGNEFCFEITTFKLIIKPCKPIIYNHFTPNNDGLNDSFFIANLRDYYPNFKLYIYNRWGTLVWEGDKNKPDWDGNANTNFVPLKGNLPAGTYYYVLNVNNINFPEPLNGSIFLNK